MMGTGGHGPQSKWFKSYAATVATMAYTVHVLYVNK